MRGKASVSGLKGSHFQYQFHRSLHSICNYYEAIVAITRERAPLRKTLKDNSEQTVMNRQGKRQKIQKRMNETVEKGKEETKSSQ